MRKILPIILVAGLTLTGCAQLNAARDWIDAPATQQAFNTLEVGSTAFVCKMSGVITAAAAIENALAAGGVKLNQAIPADTQTAVTVSAAVCNLLNGTVTNTTKVTTTMGAKFGLKRHH
jgi:hypothetical protein